MPHQKNEIEKRNISRLSGTAANKLTRECLQTALLILLENKPLKEITITELVKRSGVSRSAFYRSYNTKEELLIDLCNTIIARIKSAIKALEKTDRLLWFNNLFTIIKEHSSQVPLLLKPDFLNIFFKKESNLDKVFMDSSITNRYKAIAMSGALANITFHWVKSGMQESVDEISKICYDIFNAI